MIALFFEDFHLVSTFRSPISPELVSVVLTEAIFTGVRCYRFVVLNVNFPITSNTDGFKSLLPFSCISLKLPTWVYFPSMKQIMLSVDFSLFRFVE